MRQQIHTDSEIKIKNQKAVTQSGQGLRVLTKFVSVQFSQNGAMTLITVDEDF